MTVSIHKKDSNYDAIFLSPHLDDAVLSAGLLIRDLVTQGKKVLVVTFFTRGGEAVTNDARLFIHNSFHTNSVKLFEARKKEDQLATKILGASTLHLNWCDALFRVDQRNVPRYKSFKEIFSGKPHGEDYNLSSELEITFSALLSNCGHAKTYYYAPLAVGHHIDHVLIRNAAMNKLPSKRIQFWEDVPYQAEPTRIFSTLSRLSRQGVTVTSTCYKSKSSSLAKEKAVKTYSSQLTELYAAGICSRIYKLETYYSLDKAQDD